MKTSIKKLFFKLLKFENRILRKSSNILPFSELKNYKLFRKTSHFSKSFSRCTRENGHSVQKKHLLKNNLHVESWAPNDRSQRKPDTQQNPHLTKDHSTNDRLLEKKNRKIVILRDNVSFTILFLFVFSYDYCMSVQINTKPKIRVFVNIANILLPSYFTF